MNYNISLSACGDGVLRVSVVSMGDITTGRKRKYTTARIDQTDWTRELETRETDAEQKKV